MNIRHTCFASFGLVGLFVAGCAQDATVPTQIPAASGGAVSPSSNGGSASSSTQSSQGGSSNPASTNNPSGGQTQATSGSSIGGTANSSGTNNSSGATSSGGSATATGGAKPTGGATSAGGSSSSSSSNVGGKSAGGSNAGGTATGGKAAGGTSTGSTSTGSTSTGSTSTGSTSTGGTSTGGKAAGGASAGGAATGGAATGGGTSTGTCQKFSFFVTSMAAMVRLSGSNKGFGGDLRFGKSDGLTGADAICASVAATALPCAANKTWKAFLSTDTVDAITRIGAGPWYDRKERLVWNNTTEMSQDRPPSAPAIIKDDLPNEDGIPNHDYDQDGSTTDDDNHDILTGSGKDGKKIASDTTAHRCNEWTSTTAAASGTGTGTGFPGGMMMNGPMCGHSWPRQGSGTNWASSIREGGCGAGINLQDTGGATEATVGSGGGYGGIYCFATTP